MVPKHSNQKRIGFFQNCKEEIPKKPSGMLTGSSDLSDNLQLKNGIHIYDPNESSDVVCILATLQTLRANIKITPESFLL